MITRRYIGGPLDGQITKESGDKPKTTDLVIFPGPKGTATKVIMGKIPPPRFYYLYKTRPNGKWSEKAMFAGKHRTFNESL